MSTAELDLSTYVSSEHCPLCDQIIWRALAVDLDTVAYFVLLDPHGCSKDRYVVPDDEPGAEGWPRYSPRRDGSSVTQMAKGPLWAHGCFVPEVAWPSDALLAKRRLELKHARG